MFDRVINTSLVSNLEAVVRGCLRACNCIKKRLQDSCFPENFAKFLTAPPVAASEILHQAFWPLIVPKYRTDYRIFSNLVRPLISADGHFFEI